MPKLGSIFCSVVLGLLLLLQLGCRQQEDSVLVLLIPGGAMRAPVQKLVKEFEAEHPGIRVRIVTTPGRDYYVKSLTMLAGRAQVDLLWMGQGFGIFAGRGALLDLSSKVKDDASFQLNAYHPKVVDWYRYGGKLYGIPYGIDLLAIAYNKSLFEAAGLPEPPADWTLDMMLDAAKKLTRIDPKSGRTEVAGLGFIDLDPRYYGLSLLRRDQTRFALNDKRGLAWLKRNIALIHDERILQRGSDLQSMNRMESFINGQVAMVEFAPWDLTEVRNRAPFEWDVVSVPFGEGGDRVAWASSSGFCIPKASQHPDLAWALLKKLTGAEFQRAMFHSTMPALKDLGSDYLEANPVPSRLAEMLTLQNSMQANARIPLFQEVDAEWLYWKDQALLKKIAPEEALEKAQSHIDRILQLQPVENGGAEQ